MKTNLVGITLEFISRSRLGWPLLGHVGNIVILASRCLLGSFWGTFGSLWYPSFVMTSFTFSLKVAKANAQFCLSAMSSTKEGFSPQSFSLQFLATVTQATLEIFLSFISVEHTFVLDNSHSKWIVRRPSDSFKSNPPCLSDLRSKNRQIEIDKHDIPVYSTIALLNIELLEIRQMPSCYSIPSTGHLCMYMLTCNDIHIDIAKQGDKTMA